MTLAEFLLARFAEDEATARESASVLLIIRTERCAVIGSDEHRTYMHFDRHGPARVLAESEAKRRIVEHHTPDRGDDEFPLCSICTEVGPDAQGWPCLTVRLLALPYADHPEYDESWRP